MEARRPFGKMEKMLNSPQNAVTNRVAELILQKRGKPLTENQSAALKKAIAGIFSGAAVQAEEFHRKSPDDYATFNRHRKFVIEGVRGYLRKNSIASLDRVPAKWELPYASPWKQPKKSGDAAVDKTEPEEPAKHELETLPKPPERDESVFLEKVQEAAAKRNPKRVGRTAVTMAAIAATAIMGGTKPATGHATSEKIAIAAELPNAPAELPKTAVPEKLSMEALAFEAKLSGAETKNLVKTQNPNIALAISKYNAATEAQDRGDGETARALLIEAQIQAEAAAMGSGEVAMSEKQDREYRKALNAGKTAERLGRHYAITAADQMKSLIAKRLSRL
ncbi:Uncharacterised protein [Candidatus Norongarragalina meridionalis]|nr:Uncharacterised protein [Candidatus Norongarragalina meridionalis]